MLNGGWQAEDQLGACYVVPPIGSFIPHTTGCSMDRQGQRIAGLFGMDYCQEGTRCRAGGQQHRRLAEFGSAKEPTWLTEAIRLPEELHELRWLTERPPPAGDACLSPFAGGEAAAAHAAPEVGEVLVPNFSACVPAHVH